MLNGPRLTFVLTLSLAACGRGDESPRSPSQSAPKAIPTATPTAASSALAERAQSLAQKFVIVDGHVDLPYRLFHSKNPDGSISEDVSKRTEAGDFDFDRARKGGLDAPFMSIYVPASFQNDGGAKAHADTLIDMVESMTIQWPHSFKIARTPDEVRQNHKAGIVSLPMGIENGAAIEDKLGNVTHFYHRGVRYITLTHSKDNAICDSSYDTSETWKGLSPFGRKVVEEMNRVGIMVDVSHVSDNTFYQVLDITKVPVIASHSSLRHFTVDFERNMSDEMVKAVADNGGVVLVNFGSTFVSDASRRYFGRRSDAVRHYQWTGKLKEDAPELESFRKEWTAKNPPTFATVSDVADHIDRVVKLAGVEHVGFGSDFDGVGDTLPTGLKDAAAYPKLLAELLRRGYAEADLEKMSSGNLFRVWDAALAYSGGKVAPTN